MFYLFYNKKALFLLCCKDKFSSTMRSCFLLWEWVHFLWTFFLCFAFSFVLYPSKKKKGLFFFFFFFYFNFLKKFREKKENTKFIRISFHEWLAIATFYNYSFSLLLRVFFFIQDQWIWYVRLRALYYCDICLTLCS